MMSLGEIPVESWAVWRVDDNGHAFVVHEHLERTEAERLVAEFEARGHKQTYWAEREGDVLPEPVSIGDVPTWHLEEIARRRAEAEANPGAGEPWRTVLDRLRGKS